MLVQLFTEKSIDKFMTICIDHLDRIDNEVVSPYEHSFFRLQLYQAWIETFPVLAERVSLKCILSVVLPKLEDMLNSHKTLQVKRRKRAVELIGLFARVNTTMLYSSPLELSRGCNYAEPKKAIISLFDRPESSLSKTNCRALQAGHCSLEIHKKGLLGPFLSRDHRFTIRQ